MSFALKNKQENSLDYITEQKSHFSLSRICQQLIVLVFILLNGIYTYSHIIMLRVLFVTLIVMSSLFSFHLCSFTLFFLYGVGLGYYLEISNYAIRGEIMYVIEIVLTFKYVVTTTLIKVINKNKVSCKLMNLNDNFYTYLFFLNGHTVYLVVYMKHEICLLHGAVWRVRSTNSNSKYYLLYFSAIIYIRFTLLTYIFIVFMIVSYLLFIAKIKLLDIPHQHHYNQTFSPLKYSQLNVTHLYMVLIVTNVMLIPHAA